MPKTLKEVPSFLLCTIPGYWIRRIWYSRHVRQLALILMLCSWALSIGLMLFLAKDNADLYKNMFEKYSLYITFFYYLCIKIQHQGVE